MSDDYLEILKSDNQISTDKITEMEKIEKYKKEFDKFLTEENSPILRILFGFLCPITEKELEEIASYIVKNGKEDFLKLCKTFLANLKERKIFFDQISKN